MKYRTCLIALIGALLLALRTAPLAAQPSRQPVSQSTSHQQAKDSLRHALPGIAGKEKIAVYRQLFSLYMMEVRKEGVMDTLLALNDSAEAEAHRIGDITAQGVIKSNRLQVYSNMRMLDEMIEQATPVLNFLARHELWNLYYKTCYLVAQTHRRKQDFETALTVAQEFYAHAKQQGNRPGMGLAQLALAHIYSHLQRWADAEQCSRESISMLEDERSYLNILATAYNRLTISLIGQCRYDDALSVARATEAVNRRYEEAAGSPQASAWYNLWLAYIDIYRQSDRFHLALTYLNRVDSITRGSVKLYPERGHILYGLGRYKEALAVLDSAIAASPGGDVVTAESYKLMTLTRMGEPEKAVELFNSVIAKQDSSRNEAYNARLDEVRTQYEVDKHIAQKERARHYLLFALAGCLLLGALLALVLRYNAIVRRKNLNLYRRIKEQDRVAEELAQLQVQAAQMKEQLARQSEMPPAGIVGRETETEADKAPDTNSPAPSVLAPDARQLELLERLHAYLMQDDNLAHADLSRDALSLVLEVNRNVFTDAVKAVTGKTPIEYIRLLQLAEARRQIDEHPDRAIEAVAFNCGFGTPSTFYRLFRKQYGFSPSEYRKMAKKDAGE